MLRKIRLLTIGFILISSCKERRSSDLASSTQPLTPEIDGFKYEPQPGVLKELAARIGCEEAKRWVLTPKRPLAEVLPKIKDQKSPYDFLVDNIFQRSPAACGETSKKSNLDGIKALHKLVQSKGHSLSVLMIGGFGSHLTKEGALSLSRDTWKKQMPTDSFRVERVECTPNSYSTDDVCAPIVKAKIEALIKSETGKPHVYLLWGYSKGGTISTQVLAISPEIRNRVIGVVTVGSPFGGGLPMNAIVPIFDKVSGRIDSLSKSDRMLFNAMLMSGSGITGRYEDLAAVSGIADLFSPAQLPATKAGLTSVLPSERSKVLASAVPRWDLSRSIPNPITGKTDIPFFHVSAAVDVAQFRVAPDVTIDANEKVKVTPGDMNIMQTAELALVEELSRHPLSDMCVALEHSVIPPSLLPKGMKPQLLTLLHMDHMSLGFSEKPTGAAPPGEALVDSIIDSIRQNLEGAVP